MTKYPPRPYAIYRDIVDAPPEKVSEIVEGELHTTPRPSIPHANAASILGGELHGPFRRGLGGPGGWIILDEPELHLGADVLVPDLAGWRRERMPHAPTLAALELAPDWVCEVLSPSTESLDRTKKMKVFGRERVEYVWLLDPILETLEVFRFDGADMAPAGVHRATAVVRAEPFEALDLDLGLLWER